MPVTITKPQATLRELLAGLKKRTGLFGEQVMRANNIDEYYAVRGANRNLVINGDFRISQRGDYTTAANLPSSTFTLDRWVSYMSNMTGTLQHTTVTLNGETRRAAKVVLTNSTSGEALLEQRIEPVNMIVGKLYTLSTWVRTTNQSVRLRVHNGSAWVHSPLSQYASPSGQWQKITFTYLYNGPIAGYHPVQMYCSSGTSGEYYEFTDFQLEEGTVATPFERRLIGQELQLCQRYFEKNFPEGVAPQNSYTANGFSGGGLGWVSFSTTSIRGPIVQFKVSKRVAPTMTFFNGNSPTSGTLGIYDSSAGVWRATTVGASYPTTEEWRTDSTTSGWTPTTANTYLFSGYWTASAEL